MAGPPVGEHLDDAIVTLVGHRRDDAAHASSCTASPGAAVDLVPANGLSGMRSPTSRKPAPIAPATRAPPHQTASGEYASTAPPIAGPMANPPVTVKARTEM